MRRQALTCWRTRCASKCRCLGFWPRQRNSFFQSCENRRRCSWRRSRAMCDSCLRYYESAPMFEIYVSTDVETDGPVAGKHSILSIGSAAYTADKEMLSTFSANLETLPNALPDFKTAAWWLTQPEAWSACRQNLEPPRDAMGRYVTWLKSPPGKPVFVAYA